MQASAVVPEIVLGPPGTGKTTTLLRFVEEELASGTDPARIGYVSFTRRAAEEAVSRACEKFGKERADFPYFRTLHSLCFRFLGLSNSDVFEGKRTQEFAALAGVRVEGRWSDDGSLSGFGDGDRILFMENLARVRRIPIEELYNSGEMRDDANARLPWHKVDRVARTLREFKEERNLLDYTDMLLEFTRIAEKPRLDVLFVDEAQDLSRAQWEVVRALARTCRRVVVAGDDDQAIYRWAGADVDHFVNMVGQVTVLDQSWRVPAEVRAIAARPIRSIQHRRRKLWKPREGEQGVVDFVRRFHQVDLSGPDVMILARNDYVLRQQVEPVLRQRGIVFEKNGVPSVKHSTLNAIVWWERLRRGDAITVGQARKVYEKMGSGTGVAKGFKELRNFDEDLDVDMEFLRQNGGLLRDDIWHDALERLESKELMYILAARKHGEKLTAKPRIRLSTIHGAKGGEADHVILLKEIAARSYQETSLNPDDEARVWYVGITRARRRLTLVDSTTFRKPPWL
jgi:DNA helicase-2/ATP-dependent DNA helicase PcrA